MNIPYRLINDPSKAELLAMINIAIETLKDYDFDIASNPMTTEKCIILKQALPTVLVPLFYKTLKNFYEFPEGEKGESNSLFTAYVRAAQVRLDAINGL